ncbi:MAG TPA: UpxY family transcription antiterminator [Leptospiraceae bacterium]|nr:UpxY family transcription antiterminator [Leptospiraceae bacterium]HMW04672.1 UpxY family transcription antiterminator [Leptospiraceae bacterium]HMX35454.1 UpxY family transcription antiterminator [Leptospiraceae bacterium]HMY30508.1 UpxY family transcription antiterminator [Leptospiraceae bacterium]HMZ67085.1 UpxY family transcription antiterminator [Leptospiraceae bacterium]
MFSENIQSVSDSNSSQQWYAVYTKPRAEKKLKESLEKKSIENYLPLLAEKKKWSDRYKIISSPLFASYLFVKIDFKQDSTKVLREPSSVHFVYHNGKPATIEEDTIGMIRTFLEEYPDKIKVEQAEKLKKGNILEMKNGPFKGKKVTVQKIKNEYYVVVKLPMLNQTVLMEVKKEDLVL